MKKTVEVLALGFGILAFLIVLSFSSSSSLTHFLEWLNLYFVDFIVVIRAVLAFLAVSVLAKIILGNISKRMMEQRQKEMLEKIKTMQKQQNEEELAKT